MLKKTMVIGASLKPQRYSHRAIIRLNAHNQPVIAVGLREGKVGNIDIITFDTAADEVVELQQDLDTITLYLNPQRQRPYYDLLLEFKPKRVIFNPGTENPEFYKLLKDQGIEVEVACTLVMLATDQY